MKDYKQLYCDYFGYAQGDFVPSELSGAPAVDIHHIDARKRGGTLIKPRIENLMALTREEHIKYGDKKQYKAFLFKKHELFLFERAYEREDNETNPWAYDSAWIEAQINRYAFTCPVCKTFNCLNLEHLNTYSKLLTSNIR